MEDQSDETSDNDLMGGTPIDTNYEPPHVRAERIVAALIAESVNAKYTRADNAIFMTDAVGRACAAFNELLRRDSIAREIANGGEPLW